MTNSAAWQHEHEYVNTTTKVGQLSPAGGRLSVAFLVHMVVVRVKDGVSITRPRQRCRTRPAALTRVALILSIWNKVTFTSVESREAIDRR
jgi:hypothetical protein